MHNSHLLCTFSATQSAQFPQNVHTLIPYRVNNFVLYVSTFMNYSVFVSFKKLCCMLVDTLCRRGGAAASPAGWLRGLQAFTNSASCHLKFFLVLNFCNFYVREEKSKKLLGPPWQFNKSLVGTARLASKYQAEWKNTKTNTLSRRINRWRPCRRIGINISSRVETSLRDIDVWGLNRPGQGAKIDATMFPRGIRINTSPINLWIPRRSMYGSSQSFNFNIIDFEQLVLLVQFWL